MSTTAMPVDWLALEAIFCTTVASGTFCILADVAGQRTSGYSTLMGVKPDWLRSGFALYNVASKTRNFACGAVGGAVGGAIVTMLFILQPASVKSVNVERLRPTAFPNSLFSD